MLATVVVVLLTGCTAQDERITTLGDRVGELEQQLAERDALPERVTEVETGLEALATEQAELVGRDVEVGRPLIANVHLPVPGDAGPGWRRPVEWILHPRRGHPPLAPTAAYRAGQRLRDSENGRHH